MPRTEGTLDRVPGDARLAEAPPAGEVAAALDATDKDVEIGGARLAAGTIEFGLVDAVHILERGRSDQPPRVPLTTLTFALA